MRPPDNNKSPVAITEDDTFEKVFAPTQKVYISMDAIELNNQTQYFSNTNGNQSNTMAKNVIGVGFDGTLLNGQYKIMTNSMYNQAQGFGFSGASASYIERLRNYLLEIGTLQGVKVGNFTPGSGILGIGAYRIFSSHQNFRGVHGQVTPGSKVNVYINDKKDNSISTIGGYYDFSNIRPKNNEDTEKIKLEEVPLKGDVTTIKEITLNNNDDFLTQGESGVSVITGISGMQDNFFNNYYNYNGSISRKAVEGIVYSKGITNNLTMSAAVINDNIISNPSSNNILAELPFDMDTTNLLYGVARDYSYVSGQTFLLNFLANSKYDNLKFSLDSGLSMPAVVQAWLWIKLNR